jgi:hypothetical protein
MNIENYIKNVNLENELSFNEFLLQENFIKVANVKLDDSKRKTIIKFENIIEKNLWNSKCEWLYIFTINNKIVKIGGTRNGLKERTNSYLCGHYTLHRNGKNKCSQTNAYIYNTFEYHLLKKDDIEMYAYKIQETILKKVIFDKEVSIQAQTFHAYESIALDKYKEQNNSFPQLNNNCDPKYLLKK